VRCIEAEPLLQEERHDEVQGKIGERLTEIGHRPEDKLPIGKNLQIYQRGGTGPFRCNKGQQTNPGDGQQGKNVHRSLTVEACLADGQQQADHPGRHGR
jgi:hypothetical protein